MLICDKALIGPILAFDLGGSHIAAAIVGTSVHSIASRALPETATAEGALDLIEEAGRKAIALGKLECEKLAGIAMAAPGPFDYEEGKSWMTHKHPALYGVSLRAALSHRFELEQDRISFLQDAAAFLIGAIHRSGPGHLERTVGITLGTGVGSAFYRHGRIVTQGHGVPPAGEIYNLPWEHGTVEDTISTRCLVETYRHRSGQSISVREIAERVAHDDRARRTMKEFGANLGRILDVVLRDFDPQLIILGGGISNSSELFLPDMLRQLTSVQPRIEVCRHLDQAPLLGAADYWKSQMVVLS